MKGKSQFVAHQVPKNHKQQGLGADDKNGIYICLEMLRKYDAIKVVNGVASVDRDKCVGCGMCVAKCPRQIIRTGNLARHEKVVLENALKK